MGVVLLGGWQLAAMAGRLPSTIPTPFHLVGWIWTSMFGSDLLMSTGQTVWAAFAGFVLTAIAGIVVGVVAGLSTMVDRLTAGLIEFLRPIPSVVYLPLVLLLFGTKLTSVVVLVMGGAIWPVILQAAAGVRDADPVLLDAARAYNLTRLDRLRRIILPSSLPFIATGLRVAATMAIVITITAELLGTGRGLGEVIAGAYTSGNYDALFGAALVAAMLGLLTEQALLVLERRVLHWHPSIRLELQA